MKLSEVPVEQLKLGDNLVSAVGTPGKIVRIVNKKYTRFDTEIHIKWDNGEYSVLWHSSGEYVEYIG